MGMRLAGPLGCDCGVGVRRFGRGRSGGRRFHGPELLVVGTSHKTAAGAGSAGCGDEVAEPGGGVVDDGGPGVVVGQVQQSAAAGAGEGGRDGE